MPDRENELPGVMLSVVSLGSALCERWKFLWFTHPGARSFFDGDSQNLYCGDHGGDQTVKREPGSMHSASLGIKTTLNKIFTSTYLKIRFLDGVSLTDYISEF